LLPKKYTRFVKKLFRANLTQAERLWIYYHVMNDGFIDEELVPTAGKIPAKLWFPVKDAALKYARTAKG
jgi:hypothetical protein